jgi:hypothetical protein
MRMRIRLHAPSCLGAQEVGHILDCKEERRYLPPDPHSCNQVTGLLIILLETQWSMHPRNSSFSTYNGVYILLLLLNLSHKILDIIMYTCVAKKLDISPINMFLDMPLAYVPSDLGIT